MSNYIVGGWTQRLDAEVPPQFSYTMYGMVTNLDLLKTGSAGSPGWGPEATTAPSAPENAMWTYGGGGCFPDGRPSNPQDIERIRRACYFEGDTSRPPNWAGVDFDDECGMNVPAIAEAIDQLGSLESSFTFLAGYDYIHNSGGANRALEILKGGNCKRFVMMCYAAKMWPDYETYVRPAIEKTIEGHGIEPCKVVLALTPAGLNDENLAYFLDQVIDFRLAGLFVWNFTTLKGSDLEKILTRLGIEQSKTPLAGP